MTSLWAAALVLGGLIFIHELGHFFVARWLGVEVKTFSLGFGPRLTGFKRGATDYRLSLVPLGGYVKMLGEAPDEEVAQEKKAVSFSHQKVGRRLAIVAAGPVANFILAVFIFGLILFFYGQPSLLPQVGKVLDGYPAQEAGFKEGDLILALDGQEVKTWEEMAARIAGHGPRPIKVLFKRGEETLTTTLTPILGQASDIFGQTISKPMIGISPSGQTFTRQLGPASALVGGFVQTYQVAKLTWTSIVKLIKRQIPMSTLGGPLFIAQAAGQQAKAGAVNLLFFMGLLSVNLALLNILPIPVLDGGHLLFFSIEAVFRRPVSLRIRERAQQAGLVFILFLFATLFYNDIVRLITGPLSPQ